jgi:hypothetical protein
MTMCRWLLRVWVFLLVIIWAASMAPPAMAVESCSWVPTVGEASLENVTAEEARQLATRRARARAIEEVAGVEVQSGTIVRDQVFAGEVLRILARGFVVEQSVERWEQDNVQRTPDSAPTTIYRVFLRTCVARMRGDHDPYFRVDASLNKYTFAAREHAFIRVRCSQGCYLSILNLTGKDEFNLLLPTSKLPNLAQHPPRAGPEGDFVFPPPGVALEMAPLEGHQRDTEAFLVIAMKGPLNLPAIFRKEEGISFEEVSHLLLGLPPSEWADAWLVYEVRAK